ncbi:MAG: cupin domain-containing protein [Lysobacterales bacterium]
MNEPIDLCALDGELAGQLGAALAAAPMPAAQQARLRQRVLDLATPAGVRVVRADAGHWQLLLPGVHIKRLRVDPAAGTETTLWRLEAGARIPAHPHGDEEECLVLEGSVRQGGIDYQAGDYLHAAAGSVHLPMDAPTGALLLIRSQCVHTYLHR